jgi:SAM-dependent methyltransferase
MTSHVRLASVSALLALIVIPAARAQHSSMPAGMSHAEQMAHVKEADTKQHGHVAMGFDPDKTTHHFNLASDGGVIAVAANDPADRGTRDQVRAHLREIAVAFGRGDFQKPFLTHGETPPGVAVMHRLTSEITFVFEETERGGIVRISTSNPEALRAVHQFLTYQITEHATGDPVAPPHASPHGDAGPSQHAHGAAIERPDHFAHRFDDPEAWSKSFDDPARDEWQMPSQLIETLDIRPGQVIADIGAGTGYFTVRLAKTPAQPKVYAVDIEPSMVEHVRRRAEQEGLANVTAVQAGPDRTNLPEPVDLVLIVDTYHHIPHRVGYFTTLKSTLKPGARLAIVDFRKGAPSGPPEEFRFTPEQIAAELAQAGWSLQRTHDFLPRQMFLLFSVK